MQSCSDTTTPWRYAILALFGALLLPCTQADAQSTERTPRVVEAERRAGEIAIDGRLDEAAWQGATPVSGFVQSEPVEGAEAREDTEVRILYDEDAIYVGARMYDRDPDAIARTLTRRGEGGRAYDYFQIDLDTDHDRRTAFVFRITAAGVQTDRYRYDNTRSDGAWQAVWESAVHHDDEGWSAELRIPLSQLRYTPSDEPQTWGVNFGRRRVESNERTYFELESQRVGRGVSVYGHLRGLRLTRAPRRIEARPYVLGEARQGPAAAGDPFFGGRSASARAGLDARAGIGAALVVDATVLPDFGQVEVDPAVINLTAFETFFPERRPFFTRDARVFDFNLSGPNNRLFYSRRIGRSPQGRARADADFVSMPSQSEILGAAKVTGRTAGGFNLGGLAAWTRPARARTYHVEADTFATVLVEPGTGYGVLRGRQDLREGETQVGGIATYTVRDLPGDGTMSWLPSTAASAGADFDHAWGNRTWGVSGYLAGSHVRGSPEAMVRIQRSANHYHQRPDATYLAVDSAATSISGAEWRIDVDRLRGEHWTGSAWLIQRTPGFEVGDLGFGQGRERIGIGSRIRYSENDPGEVFRSYRFTGFFYENWRHSMLEAPLESESWRHARSDAQYTLSANGTLLNYWSIDGSVRRTPEVLADHLTRGGPLMIRPGGMRVSAGFSSDPRGDLSFGASVRAEAGTREDFSRRLSGDIRWRPSQATRIDLSPTVSRERNTAQYVAQITDPGYEATFGTRYLFADIDRHTVSMQARFSHVFSPTLTVEVFAQPMIASGAYLSYKQLARPASFDFDVLDEGTAEPLEDGVRCVGGRTCVRDDRRYFDLTGDGAVDFETSDRDFTVRSLRGNAVLRWEYRPGSTLYAVWQHNRSSRIGEGDVALVRDVPALFEIDPDNVFMLKLNYWIDL